MSTGNFNFASRSPSLSSRSSADSNSKYSASAEFVKEPCARMLKKDFNCILTMADDIPDECETILAERVVAFCDSTGILDDLLDWFCKTEVMTIDSKLNLFQGGLMRDLLLHTVMNDRSEYWFALIYERLVEKITEREKQGISLDKATGMDNIRKMAEEFIQILNDSLFDCPVILRRMWNNLKNASNERWGEDEGEFIFYRFIDLLIKQLTNAATVRGLEPRKFAILKQFFQLFEELSGFASDPSLMAFVDENRPKLIAFYDQLVDDKDVQRVISVLNASKHGKAGMNNFLQAKVGFDSWYNSVSIHAPRTNASIQPSKKDVELDEEQLKEFLEKVNSPSWKLLKDRSGFASYMANFDDNETKALKIVTKVKAPLGFACAFFGTAIGHPDYNDHVAKSDFYQVTPTTSFNIMTLHLPWPMAKRQFCSRRAIMAVPKEESIVHIASSLDFEPLKGYVPVFQKVSGFKLDTDPKDPSFTIVTFIDDFDAKFAMPVWFVNQMRKTTIDKFIKIAKDCEKPVAEAILNRMIEAVIHGPLPDIYQKKNAPQTFLRKGRSSRAFQ